MEDIALLPMRARLRNIQRFKFAVVVALLIIGVCLEVPRLLEQESGDQIRFKEEMGTGTRVEPFASSLKNTTHVYNATKEPQEKKQKSGKRRNGKEAR
mmetsp:Transcript_65039/g.89395  ORF Transcript_65039/g.89395 Transcript_65039/m.89395 type:complete len:98 (+) Transcript_65039:200-493(+)